MGKWDKYKKNKNKENVEQKDTNKGLPATCINCSRTKILEEVHKAL